MNNPLEQLKKLPTWGKAAIGVGGLGVVYLAFRAHKQNTVAAAATTSSDTDPVTGLPYSEDNQVDPATGMTYLSEAQEYGSVSSAEAAFASGAASGYVPSSEYSGTGGYVDEGDGYYYDPSTNTTTTTSYGNNAAWSQAVISGLSEIGYNETDVAAAIGDYLAGKNVTADQATIIYAALSEYGNPPTGSYTVKMLGGTTGPTGPAPVTPEPTVTNGHVVSVSNNTAVVAWTGSVANSWKVTINGPGKVNGKTATVATAQAAYSGLEAGHTYDVTVQPLVSGKAKGTPGKITFATKAATTPPKK